MLFLRLITAIILTQGIKGLFKINKSVFFQILTISMTSLVTGMGDAVKKALTFMPITVVLIA